MKLKAIAAAFKKGKFLRTYTMPNGEQWIGNGAALYKMSGMPELTPAVVLKIFDIPAVYQRCSVKPCGEIRYAERARK